jgi:hypothetical protein
MNQPSSSNFRIATFLLAAVLGIQCIWLLLAEFSRPGIDYLPTDPHSAAFASFQRNDATWAAWIGVIRGDLWGESGYTYSDLLWINSSSGSELTKSLDQARERLDRAVRYAPHQAGAWLLLAGLASRYRWSKPDPAEALRMSYYTGPSELPLAPLRSLVAAQLPALDDELQIFAKRELRLLITHQDKPAIVQDYQSATPAGKQFIKQVLGEIDPTFGNSLHLGAQGQAPAQ